MTWKDNNVRSDRDQQLSKGVELRAQIDTETVRALLLMNGGGAVALLSVLPTFLTLHKSGMVVAILIGLIVMMIGLVSAVLHNHYRRQCSLQFEQHRMNPPSGRVAGIALRQPTVCALAGAFLYFSIFAFIIAGLFIATVGLVTIGT